MGHQLCLLEGPEFFSKDFFLKCLMSGHTSLFCMYENRWCALYLFSPGQKHISDCEHCKNLNKKRYKTTVTLDKNHNIMECMLRKLGVNVKK